MKLFEISNYLDKECHWHCKKNINCGLLIGNKNTNINSILVSLDCTQEVVDEAINNNHNLIVSHHPLIFSGVKKIMNQLCRKKIKRLLNMILQLRNAY